MRFVRSIVCAASLFAISGSASAWTLTVVHTNDVHSHVEPTMIKGKAYGGYARLATVVKQIREKNKDTLLLNAGDTFQGTLYYGIYKGLADAYLMNLLGYQAATIGNHEFDDGPEGLLGFAKQINFPLYCCNLDFSAYPDLARRVKPWGVAQVGKEKVGLIGAITPDLPEISAPGNVRNLDLNQSIARAIKELEAQKINKIILLSHCGFSEERELAKSHPQIDIIIGGHSHTMLGELALDGFPKGWGSYPTKVGTTYLVSSWEWAKVVGKLKVDFDKSGVITKVVEAQVIPVDESVAEDPVVAQTVTMLQRPLIDLKKTVVGETVRGLAKGEESRPESPIGNIIADAQLEATHVQKTEICLMNKGGIRSGIEPGPVTYDEVVSVQPFGNTLVVLELTGQEIKDALEVGASKAGLLQVSKGFSYTVNPRAQDGAKIESMQLNGQALDLRKNYRCVVNNFMARGGDGFTSLGSSKGYRYDTGLIDLDALIDFMKKNKPTESSLEGRVKISVP